MCKLKKLFHFLGYKKKISKYQKNNSPIYIKNMPFIHVPKCGGSSLVKSVNVKHADYHHATLRAMTFHNAHLRNETPLAFVREPFERFKSAIYYMMGSKYYNLSEARKKFGFDNEETTIDFINNFKSANLYQSVLPFRTLPIVFIKQKDMLVDVNGQIDMNHIYKFDSINIFLSHNNLKVVNENNTNYKKLMKKNIESALEENRKKILSIYEEDIKIFKNAKNFA